MKHPLHPHHRFITVVSGLPRSGTSMMLQMLSAGGLEVLSDGRRAADADNPRGYLELEGVKSLERDASWVPDAQGKAVKVIYYLLYSLPLTLDYRVIFMRRNLDEVLASQQAMLERRGAPVSPAENIRLKELFRNELAEVDAWLAANRSFAVLDVDYASVLTNPFEQSRQVAEFLGIDLDAGAMSACVDASLYRSRPWSQDRS